MSKGHLRPCPSCARHVRVSETACAFCGARLSEAFRASPAPVPFGSPSVRLSRAALFALGTGAASLAGACGGATVPVGDGGTSENGGYDGNLAPPYGLAPIPEDAGGDQVPEDAGADTSTTKPPPPDASVEDAGVNTEPPYGAPPYGLPPPPPGDP